MQIKASLKNYRKSAQKVREVANLLRGMKIEKAVSQLLVWDKGSCRDLLNLVKSTVANAENNFKLKEENLYIAEIKVNEGATLKRWRPRAHGKAAKILKRTCHIEIILDEKQEIQNKSVEKKEEKKKVDKVKVDKKIEKKEEETKEIKK